MDSGFVMEVANQAAMVAIERPRVHGAYFSPVYLGRCRLPGCTALLCEDLGFRV